MDDQKPIEYKIGCFIGKLLAALAAILTAAGIGWVIGFFLRNPHILVLIVICLAAVGFFIFLFEMSVPED